MGDGFLLDGCASLFGDDLMCDLAVADLEMFSITWLWDEIEVASDTLQFMLETGDGTMFDKPEEYMITLRIIYPDDLNTLRSSDQMRLSLLDPRQVGSPTGLMLVVLALAALGYMRWRQFWN